MRWMLPRMVGEVVRGALDADRVGAYMTVALSDVSGCRAREAARYRVGLSWSWRADLGLVHLCTPAGQPVEWRLHELAAWLESVLDGWPLVVAMEFNASRLSMPYTGRRLARQEAYMATLDAGELMARAGELRAAVAALPVDGVRRPATEARAAVLESVADTLGMLAGVTP